MQQEPLHVPNHLLEQTWHHSTKEIPCPVTDTKPDLGNQDQEKDDHVDGIGAEIGKVEDALPGGVHPIEQYFLAMPTAVSLSGCRRA